MHDVNNVHKKRNKYTMITNRARGTRWKESVSSALF